MRHCLRDRTLRALAVAVLLGVPACSFAGPPASAPAKEHRAVIDRVQPVYPELALRMHITGEVFIRVEVLPNGTVSQTHIESGHTLLRQAADDAVRHWRFAPATHSSECMIGVDFDSDNR